MEANKEMCKFSIEEKGHNSETKIWDKVRHVCALAQSTGEDGLTYYVVDCEGKHCDKLNCPKWSGRQGCR